MQKIGVLDCNNFFVSCERIFRPDLIKKPVVVLSGNDGCVVARSQEIKDMGIPMGAPYFQIKDSIKDSGTTVFSSNFTLYRDVSSRVFSIVKEEFGVIEQYSIDECFFNISDGIEEIIPVLKNRIQKEVGIPVSIGAAASKTQAKYVNAVAKRTTGVEIWDNERWLEASPEIKLSEIWGVGRGRLQQFSKHNIYTVANLCAVGERVVGSLFGVEGIRLRAELLGRQIFSVKFKREQQKTVMSSRSFSASVYNLSDLEEAVKNHIYTAVEEIKSMKLLAKTLRVSINTNRYSDFLLKSKSLEVNLDSPTDDLFILTKRALEALKKCYLPGVPYKKAGVVLSNLITVEAKPSSLFPDTTSGKTTELSDLLFAVNNKYSDRKLIQLGVVNSRSSAKLKTKKDLLSPAYTTSWTRLRTVKTTL